METTATGQTSAHAQCPAAEEMQHDIARAQIPDLYLAGETVPGLAPTWRQYNATYCSAPVSHVTIFSALNSKLI